MKYDVLAFGAHPDDVELGAGGTLAKMTAQGALAAIVDLTHGEMGTRGTVDIRLEEARLAAEILGVRQRVNLGLEDGFFRNDKATQLKVIAQIRRFRPEVVLANTPRDRHPDHGRGATLVREAVFLSGLSKVKTTWEDVEQEPWRPEKLYYYFQFYEPQPHVAVDITGFEELRMQSILAHRSQVYDPNSNEPETVISSKAFLESTQYRCSNWGRLIGVESAEAFETERLIGVRDLRDLL
ncbi:bacillithiol biosynthesis deacetylase BshB1 [bacterium]|nr:bacillithiol biosynthesis deacetylase BshB1 [bacterium]